MKSLKILLLPVAIAVCSSYAKNPVTNFAEAIHFGAQRCQSMNSVEDFMELIKEDGFAVTPRQALLVLNQKVEGQDAMSLAMSKRENDRCLEYAQRVGQIKKTATIMVSMPAIADLTLQQIFEKAGKDERFKEKLNDVFARAQ
jgi:hypothetical protein